MDDYVKITFTRYVRFDMLASYSSIVRCNINRFMNKGIEWGGFQEQYFAISSTTLLTF
jgi:hypothetical protein